MKKLMASAAVALTATGAFADEAKYTAVTYMDEMERPYFHVSDSADCDGYSTTRNPDVYINAINAFAEAGAFQPLTDAEVDRIRSRSFPDIASRKIRPGLNSTCVSNGLKRYLTGFYMQ
jgi:hypothetical protein